MSDQGRYRVLSEHGRDIILFIRPEDGRIIEANHTAVLAYGYDQAALLSMTIADLRAPHTRPLLEEQMAQADARGILFETEHQRRDGSTFPVEVSSRGTELDGERILLSIIRDISARRRAEQAHQADRERLQQALTALQEADRRKNDYLAMLAHELRNALAPIRNATHLLALVPPLDPDLERLRDVIDRQVGHMTRILDDLLDVSRISRGKLLLRRGPLDLCELVRHAVEDHRGTLSAAGVRLALSLPPDATPVPVHGDATRLTQVVGNLLHNAAKFTPAAGLVTVALRQEGESALLSVRDTGVGIDPELLQSGRVFEPFSQGEMGLDRGQGGLGLGLALVRGLIVLHGGEVDVRSDGRGEGAEFVVRLPIAAARQDAPASSGGAATTPPGRARRVPIIEDHPDIAESLRELVADLGHEVQVARNGRRALEIARAFCPDRVICDIGLPGMDGYQVARELRADPALLAPAARLIALTGYGQLRDQERARAAGFDAHQTKPCDPGRLEALLA